MGRFIDPFLLNLRQARRDSPRHVKKRLEAVAMNPLGCIRLTSWNASFLITIFRALTPRLLQVEAALSGATPCTVYVDQEEAPRAVALQIGVCWYIAGDPATSFLNGINALLPRDTYSVIILDPSITASQRALLFDDLYFVRATSRYAQRETADPIIPTLHPNYDCVPIDRDFLESNVQGAEDLRANILHFWMDLEAFEQSGFGFAVIREAEVVSHSLTDHVVGDRCEIGVSTDPDHRLKGLAAYVSTRTANEAFTRGLKHVGWMSWANNAGSIAVSLKAGFIEMCQYDVYINHWPAENPEDMSADEFRTFAQEYERQFVERPPSDSGYPHVVAATAWALAGDGEACRKQLHDAIAMGWLTSQQQLRKLWPELFGNPRVLEDDAWLAVLNRLKRE